MRVQNSTSLMRQGFTEQFVRVKSPVEMGESIRVRRELLEHYPLPVQLDMII